MCIWCLWFLVVFFYQNSRADFRAVGSEIVLRVMVGRTFFAFRTLPRPAVFKPFPDFVTLNLTDFANATGIFTLSPIGFFADLDFPARAFAAAANLARAAS